MGTSAARRAPTSRFWRLAKAAATRYLSAEDGGAVDAREVAARYIAALGEGGATGPAEVLAVFRQTRLAAQNLGAFCCQAGSQGWRAALEDRGLKDLTEAGPEIPTPSLGAVLENPGGGLEQAVAHAALMVVLQNLPMNPEPEEGSTQVVRRFLVEAFQLRLALDLGESLEAAASGITSLRQGLTGLAALIDQAAVHPNAGSAPQTPEEWLGLPGWTWVSSLLTGLILNLTGQVLSKNS
ncbi:MAG: hypothetical protein M1438_20940 [Deltaproteobacteria bacterium]|nr:hypothetical protein [Deltaproteobacteria bacterium]